MQTNDFQRFEEPTDVFYCEDWQGAEIYEGEEYLEFYGGDKVLNFPENIAEYLTEHTELFKELISGVSVRKVARNG